MENEIKLYHRQVAWDNYFDYICRRMLNSMDIVLSEHAKAQFDQRDIDKGYIFALLKYNRKGEIFEVEKQGKYVEKFVIRMPYDLHDDVSIVLSVHYDEQTNSRYLIMPTIWLNNRYDRHFTLDENKYEKFL